jgi:hypothetical protein
MLTEVTVVVRSGECTIATNITELQTQSPNSPRARPG